MLIVRNVSKSFGGIKALNKISVKINEREIVGLIGPNGSGKTTLFNVISGMLKPDEGVIEFRNTRIDNLPPEKISQLGIARTFQGIRLLDDLTVLDNVVISSLPRSKSVKEAETTAIESLEFDGKKKHDSVGGQLDELEKRLVEVARALAAKPMLILFDEIMAGLTEGEQIVLANLLNKIREELRIAIFWIEHVLHAMFSLVNVDRVIVLNWGNKIAEGSPDEILNNREVVEAYLGETFVGGMKC